MSSCNITGSPKLGSAAHKYLFVYVAISVTFVVNVIGSLDCGIELISVLLDSNNMLHMNMHMHLLFVNSTSSLIAVAFPL